MRAVLVLPTVLAASFLSLGVTRAVRLSAQEPVEIAVLNTGVVVKKETIPEQIARGSFGRWRGPVSGVAPGMRELIRGADLVVHGTIHESSSYLSQDQADVYTDHVIASPIVLFQREIVSSRQPSAPTPIKITQLGGTIAIGDVTFIQVEESLPLLRVGTEGVFVSTRRDGKYLVADHFYGAFQIANGVLNPLAARLDFAPGFRNIPAATAIENLRTIIRENVRQ